MYKSLLEAGVPVIIVDLLHNWYSKLSYAVRWNGCISAYCKIDSGVRQGSCISPAIFYVFVNLFITRLRYLGVGCCISSIFLGWILYADDILLLSPTVSGLQNMLDKCAEAASILSLEFNVTKSQCVVIGKICKSKIMPMNLNGNDVIYDVIQSNTLVCICKVTVVLSLILVILKEISMRRVTPFFT